MFWLAECCKRCHTMTSPSQTIVLVTGANQGIGYEIIKTLSSSRQSYHIFLGSRSAANGVAAVARLGKLNNVIPSTLDWKSDTSIAACLVIIKDEYGRLDILINNAATSECIMDPHLSMRTKFTVFDVNVFGVIMSTWPLRYSKRSLGPVSSW